MFGLYSGMPNRVIRDAAPRLLCADGPAAGLELELHHVAGAHPLAAMHLYQLPGDPEFAPVRYARYLPGDDGLLHYAGDE